MDVLMTWGLGGDERMDGIPDEEVGDRSSRALVGIPGGRE